MTHEFSSSVLKGGDPTAPEKIVISDKLVTWKKNKGVNWFYLKSDSITISRKNIVSVEIHRKVIGCSIEINSFGFQSICADNFSVGDAEEIQKILLY
jgi:hypothetical protein